MPTGLLRAGQLGQSPWGQPVRAAASVAAGPVLGRSCTLCGSALQMAVARETGRGWCLGCSRGSTWVGSQGRPRTKTMAAGPSPVALAQPRAEPRKDVQDRRR